MVNGAFLFGKLFAASVMRLRACVVVRSLTRFACLRPKSMINVAIVVRAAVLRCTDGTKTTKCTNGTKATLIAKFAYAYRPALDLYYRFLTKLPSVVRA